MRPFAAVRFKICSGLASVMRALPPQSWQVFCLNGKRDPTLLVGQSARVDLFVGTMGS